MKAQNEQLIAESFGIAAFEMDKPCIPALDSNLMEMLNVPVGEGTHILKAWIAGWTKANLAAPVEF